MVEVAVTGSYNSVRFQIWRHEGLFCSFIPSMDLRTSFKKTIAEAMDRGIHYMGGVSKNLVLVGVYKGHRFDIITYIPGGYYGASITANLLHTSIRKTPGEALERVCINIEKYIMISNDQKIVGG